MTTHAASKLNALLSERYGIVLPDDDMAHLEDVMAHYADRRRIMLVTEGEMAIRSEEWSKALLIDEAARAMLREIAPKRRRKRKNKGN